MNKRPFLVKIIVIFLVVITFFSIVTVTREITQLGSHHGFFRILDILLRTTGGILSLIAIVGLWEMKRYGYNSALLSSGLEILLRLLVFLPGVKVEPTPTFFTTFTKFGNLQGIIIFTLIIFYLYRNRNKFI